MNRFRGDEGAAGRLAASRSSSIGGAAGSAAVTTEDLEEGGFWFREDLDRYVHQSLSSSPLSSACGTGAPSFREEDCYLPRSVPRLVLDLPETLRRAPPPEPGLADDRDHREVSESLERLRNETRSERATQFLSYIFPWATSSKNDRSWWSYGRFGLRDNNSETTRFFLECLPTLRRIGISERAEERRAAEKASSENKNDTENDAAGRAPATHSLRRSTRALTRAAAPPPPRRHHYFDRISVVLRRDEADLDTSAVGALFADQWRSKADARGTRP